jgi:hypothetical protein
VLILGRDLEVAERGAVAFVDTLLSGSDQVGVDREVDAYGDNTLMCARYLLGYPPGYDPTSILGAESKRLGHHSAAERLA